MTNDKVMIEERKIAAWIMLLTGARRSSGDELAAVLSRFSERDWAGIVEVASNERLAAAIDAFLRSCDLLDLVPSAVRACLREEHKSSQMRFFQYLYSLTRVGELLNSASIPFRLLKGQAVAVQAYTDPAARNAVDIDLWVLPSELPRALDLLRRYGMRLAPVDNAQMPFRLAYGNEVTLVPDAGNPIPTPVDLHWHLVGAWWQRATLRIPDAVLFERSYPVVVADHTYQTLDQTDNLWYLCLHAGVGHQFEGLGWQVDMGLLIEKYPMDWPRLNALAEESGTRAIVWRCFEILDRALGSNHRNRLEWRPSPPHGRLMRQLLPGFPRKMQISGEFESDLRMPTEQLVLLSNPGAMLKALRYLLWPPARWMRLRYGVKSRRGSIIARIGHLARLRGLFRRKR